MIGAAQTGPSVANQAGALRASESSALLQLYAAEAALARAQDAQARLDARSNDLAQEEADATLRTEIVRRSRVASATGRFAVTAIALKASTISLR